MALAGTAGDKLAIVVAGSPILIWTLGLARDAVATDSSPAVGGRPHLLCVVANGSPLTQLARDARYEPVVALHAGRGMSWSLDAGLRAAHQHAPGAGALVLLGDDPLAALALPDVLAAVGNDPLACACVERRTNVPHPVYLPPALVVSRPQRSGDAGLRALLDADPGTQRITTSAPEPVDVDTPADIELLRARLTGFAPYRPSAPRA